MKMIRSAWSTLGLSLALAAGSGMEPVFAHHSFGLYEMSKAAEIEGTVTKMEWSNPHCWLFVLVVPPAGVEIPYGFEMQSVGEMVRKGWTKTALKPGDKVKVNYRPARDGRPAGLLVSVTTSDGRTIGRIPNANGQNSQELGQPSIPAAPPARN